MSLPLRKEPEPERNEPSSDVQRVRPMSRPAEPDVDDEERLAHVRSSDQDIVENDDIIDGDVASEMSDDRSGAGNFGRKARRVSQSAMPIDSALFPSNELQQLQNRWDKIQTDFVDQPRDAVREADHLVSSAMQRLADVFSTERAQLEQQWDRGDRVSTEDLRIALQRYRSFFQRVLSV